MSLPHQLVDTDTFSLPICRIGLRIDKVVCIPQSLFCFIITSERKSSMSYNGEFGDIFYLETVLSCG
jgi:hypothetical protein